MISVVFCTSNLVYMCEDPIKEELNRILSNSPYSPDKKIIQHTLAYLLEGLHPYDQWNELFTKKCDEYPSLRPAHLNQQLLYNMFHIGHLLQKHREAIRTIFQSNGIDDPEILKRVQSILTDMVNLEG